MNSTDLALVAVGLILFIPVIVITAISRKLGDKRAIPAAIGCAVIFAVLLGSMGYGLYLSDEVDHEVLHLQGGSTFSDRLEPAWLRAVVFSWFFSRKYQPPDCIIARGNSLLTSGQYRYAESVYWGIIGFHKRPDSVQEILSNIRNLSNSNKEIVAHGFAGLGKVYTYTNKYPFAEITYLQAINTYREANDRAGLAATENNLALLFQKQGKHAEAKKLLNDALSDSRTAKDESMMKAIHRNIEAVTSEPPMVAPSR